ncbi:hypothetical protein Ddye_012653 [Dipteronia dyeriana]|uniref:Yippee domain-containing protein n=1 Tax=Dipteronia dyeriana TaxID=168575 RepID=A0AAE0CIU7_9ROSI|nr:hypothetical protein Ddye_012653 [Dipteronia dyeriana]
MGRLFIESLSGPRIFKCKCCKVDSASHDHIVSKEFQGRYGRAYLFRSVVNVCLGPTEERLLTSGLHTVNDIYCSSCQQILGWRYEKAYEESQKYKEGMYILEKERMLKVVCTDNFFLMLLIHQIMDAIKSMSTGWVVYIGVKALSCFNNDAEAPRLCETWYFKVDHSVSYLLGIRRCFLPVSIVPLPVQREPVLLEDQLSHLISTPLGSPIVQLDMNPPSFALAMGGGRIPVPVGIPRVPLSSPSRPTSKMDAFVSPVDQGEEKLGFCRSCCHYCCYYCYCCHYYFCFYLYHCYCCHSTYLAYFNTSQNIESLETAAATTVVASQERT